MSRFNTTTGRAPRSTGALKTVSKTPDSYTHEGGPGFSNDAYGELFRLGVNLFAGGEDTFYEKGKARDQRFGGLVSQLAVSDPQWTLDFLVWLRDKGFIRTASVMGAVYAIHARLNSGSVKTAIGPGAVTNRKFAALVPQRLDEVPEMFAMWQQLFPKEPFPMALKRGANDSLRRMANEYSMLKYNTASHAMQIADVLNIAHTHPADHIQEQLFRMALENRYGNTYETHLLPMVEANVKLRKDAEKNPKVLLNPAALKAAGFTWNNAMSLAGDRVPKAQLWEALILSNSVPYEATLKNLRNMQEAGIGREATDHVKAFLANPQAVTKSRQFPYRFWAAYKNATGTQWAEPLETALSYSVQNIPELDGNTVGLIDSSASMTDHMSGNSTMMRVEAAALFAAATALKNAGKFDLYIYASGVAPVKFRSGDSLLRTVDSICRRIGEVGHGTQTAYACSQVYKHHNRVMVFTDMQSFGGYGVTADHVDPGTWVYHWDLGGYTKGDIPSGTGRTHQLGGLTDATMKSIPLLERGSASKWPWQQ